MKIAVLISGAGLTLKAVLDAIAAGALSAHCVGVVADREAAGLKIAAEQGISMRLIDRKRFAKRAEFEAAIGDVLKQWNPDLIVLAGFMRVLSAEFVAQFPNQIINLHPSLLPKFPGLDTYQRALDAGETEHGATVHWVSAELDGGPIIAQARLAIEAQDSAQSLAARIKPLEQALLVDVLRKLSRG